jgi:hypothetical protein
MKLMLQLVAVLGTASLGATGVQAQVFDAGVPAGYTCTGTCGVSGANGSVTLAPNGGSQFGWISTDRGALRNPLGILGTTNGSTLLSSAFTASAGQALSFSFNFITSDGANHFTDYGFVRLIGLSGTAILFSARSLPGGNTVPGFGLPGLAPGVAITPSSTPIIRGAPSFSPLGSSSGECFGSVGCGMTGWLRAEYVVPVADTYRLEFNVFNMVGTGYQSALAFDFGSGSGGTPVVTPSVVPEPGTCALTVTGLLGLVGVARRRRTT